AVLEAALRSFAPIEPLCLRWTFPVWVPAEDLDPQRLKRPATNQDAQKANSEEKVIAAIVKLGPRGEPVRVQSIADETGLKWETVKSASGRLALRGEVAGDEVERGIGNGAKRTAAAVKLIKNRRDEAAF